MRLMGAAAPCARPVVDEVAETLHAGRPAFLWCDGDDVTVIVGDEGDQAEQLLKLVRRTLPEVA